MENKIEQLRETVSMLLEERGEFIEKGHEEDIAKLGEEINIDSMSDEKQKDI